MNEPGRCTHPEGVCAADVAAPGHVVAVDVLRQRRVAQGLGAEPRRVLVLRGVQVDQQEAVLPVRRQGSLLYNQLGY